jgi:hypothetical protein
MLKIQERVDVNGELSPVFLHQSEGVLAVVSGGNTLPLPEGALERVMARYGAPFDMEATVAVVDRLDLGAGHELRHVRHLAGYDVVARDYLVLLENGKPGFCAIAPIVASALAHLASVAHASASDASRSGS